MSKLVTSLWILSICYSYNIAFPCYTFKFYHETLEINIQILFEFDGENLFHSSNSICPNLSIQLYKIIVVFIKGMIDICAQK